MYDARMHACISARIHCKVDLGIARLSLQALVPLAAAFLCSLLVVLAHCMLHCASFLIILGLSCKNMQIQKDLYTTTAMNTPQTKLSYLDNWAAFFKHNDV